MTKKLGIKKEISKNNPSSPITEEILGLLQEAYESRTHDLNQSAKLASKALELSRGLKDDELIGQSLSRLSLFEMIRGSYSESIDLAKSAISHFQKVENEVGIADAKYTIAGALYKTDEFKEGLSYLIDCLLIYQRYGDFHNEARTRKSIGTIYEYYGDQQAAIASYNAAIVAAKKVDDLNLQSNAMNPLSGILLNQGKVDEALALIEEAISFKKQGNDIRGLAFSLYGRGKVFTKQKLYDRAETDFLESIRIHREMGEKLGIGMTYHKLGALYFEKKDYQKAEQTLFEALSFANDNNIALIKFKCNYLLHQLHKEKGDAKKSLHYLEQYVKEKELVVNTTTSRLIESYDAISKMEAVESEMKAEKERSAIIEQKNLELDAFFYRVSHDLKGPISSLIGLDTVARMELKDSESLQFLDMYKEQVLRVDYIIDSLIKFTRNNHFADIAEDIDFSKVINECIASFNYLSNFDLIQFYVDVEPNIQFKAEWALVNTIIQNLIENSIKYVRKEQKQPSIWVGIKKADENIVLTVADNGMGMDEMTRDNIFNMFYQANTDKSGTGLGLFILKKSVERLGGKVQLESKIREGTTFEISIPPRKNVN